MAWCVPMLKECSFLRRVIMLSPEELFGVFALIAMSLIAFLARAYPERVAARLWGKFREGLEQAQPDGI